MAAAAAAAAAAPHIRRGGLSNPLGVLALAPGKVLVVEAGRSRIVCCSGSALENRETVAGEATLPAAAAAGTAAAPLMSPRLACCSPSLGPSDASTADQARLFQPRFLAAAAGGTVVFFTDHNTVRRFVPSTGEVRTIAGVPVQLQRAGSPAPPGEGGGGGNDAGAEQQLQQPQQQQQPLEPSARFDAPMGLAADEDGRVLFVADSVAHAVKRVDLATGEVSVLVGAGCGLRYPVGLALGRGGDALFVTDEGGVKRVEVATGLVANHAGYAEGFQDGPALQAKFSSPRGICFDSLGRLFVADRGNACVRMIDAAGVVSTVVPRGICKQPTGVDVTHRGELAVTDAFTGALHLFDLELERPDAVQVPRSSFAARMAALFDGGEGADVTFSVAGERVAAHRLVLVTQSDYFRRLLDPASFAEGRRCAGSTGDADDGAIEIADTTPAAFRALLRHLYTDEMRFGDDVVLDVALLAQRLCLNRVYAHCRLHVRHNLAPSNVVTWLVWLDEHSFAGFGELRGAAWSFLLSNIRKVRRDPQQLALLMEKRPDLLVSLLQQL